jgi:broad specificity phosphatase PhoE
MALYLVRHGETDWNRVKRFQSRTDVPLNATGLAQARAVRAEFDRRGLAFAAARSSPMGRAVATAEILLDGTGLEAVIEPRFIELSMGDFEGELEADLAQRYGAAYDDWRAAQYTVPAPGGGEDIITAAARVRPALVELTALAIAGDVLVVAHQAVNMAMKVALSGRTDIDSAATFRQHNHEVDVWDAERGTRLEVFSVGPETPQGIASRP